MGAILGKKPVKEATRKLPSSREVFENHSIQIIIDGVKQKEHGNALNVIKIQLDLNLRTDFNSMSLEDLANIHENIVKTEKDIQVIDNCYKFYTGLLYLTAHNKCEETQFLKWIKKQDVSKATVYRYMSFAALIMRLPGLILSDLNFSQLLKHKERILAFKGRDQQQTGSSTIRSSRVSCGNNANRNKRHGFRCPPHQRCDVSTRMENS